jgi:uncharacterized protein (DUF488 family)
MGRGSDVPVVFTVGYEGRNPEDLIRLLRRHRVRLLIDVRLNAISRRRGFSKTALADQLAVAGIDYVHERGLGNPKDNRNGYRLGHRGAIRRYEKHLSTNGADAVERVGKLVRTTRTALLCVELDSDCCHRSAVADRLGASVVSL